MYKRFAWRFWLIFLSFLFGVYLLVSALVPRDKLTLKNTSAPGFVKSVLEFVFPKMELRLGLDLKGGVHFVLQPDFSKLPPGKKKEDAIRSALEVLRERVDQMGLTQPIIQREGTDKIVVELPGEVDPERALKVLKQVASLKFMLVDESYTQKLAENPHEFFEGNLSSGNFTVKEGVLPPDREILFFYVKDEKGKYRRGSPIVVYREGSPEYRGNFVSGAEITRADVSPSQDEIGKYQVNVAFNSRGALKFARLTGDHINWRLAIVLDNRVIAAPVIKQKIPGGMARITGGFSREEAENLALVLRTGSLPVPLVVLENRTMGPSLGKESIRQGLLAVIVGFVLVVLFMLFRYGLSGLIADVALVFNVVLLLAAMVLFSATLTLPGIAGIVLTIGMSVDANVIVFERIREELRAGKHIFPALEEGYSKAWSAIFDANLTTILTALILYVFGTGPVKGFAVTLTIGLVISLYTALFVTKTILEWLVLKLGVKGIGIR